MRAASAALSVTNKARANDLFAQAFELFRAGEFGAAARQYLRGLEIDPANPAANYSLAETYARLKNAGQAQQHYRYTLEFGKGSKEAALAEERLAAGK